MEKQHLQANENCRFCNAKAIYGAILHEPDCPTWEMFIEEKTPQEETQS